MKKQKKPPTVQTEGWEKTSIGKTALGGTSAGDPITQRAFAQALKETGGYKSSTTGARAAEIEKELRANRNP